MSKRSKNGLVRRSVFSLMTLSMVALGIGVVPSGASSGLTVPTAGIKPQ